MTTFEDARRNMVDSQLRPNRVTDPRLLDVMAELPRERFVPAALQGIAYVDDDVEVAPGRFLVEPVVLGRLVQALDLDAAATVLNIGCATGYDAALLGRLASSVVAVESDADLVAQATAVISDLAIDNVAVVEAPLTEGYPTQAPYDAIFISGAVDLVPEAIVAQLAPGGRLAAVIGGGEPGILGRASLMIRNGDTTSIRPLFDAGTAMLPGFARTPSFVF